MAKVYYLLLHSRCRELLPPFRGFYYQRRATHGQHNTTDRRHRPNPASRWWRMVWAGTLVLVHSIASDDEASPVVFDRHRAFVIMEPVREWRVSGSVSEANAKAAAPSERKLTSIVVADVVGYSRPSQQRTRMVRSHASGNCDRTAKSPHAGPARAATICEGARDMERQIASSWEGRVARRPPKTGEADTDAKPSPSLRTSAPRFKPRPTKSERAASGCRTDWSIEI